MNYFTQYFGNPKPEDINERALFDAQSHLAQYLVDLEKLQGYIASCQATITRLSHVRSRITE